MSSFRIALADDHPILREILRKMLCESDDIEVIADAGGGVELLDLLDRLPILPDMVDSRCHNARARHLRHSQRRDLSVPDASRAQLARIRCVFLRTPPWI